MIEAKTSVPAILEHRPQKLARRFRRGHGATFDTLGLVMELVCKLDEGWL